MVNRLMAIARPLLSIVIPAYNEEAGLAHSVDLLLPKLDALDF